MMQHQPVYGIEFKDRFEKNKTFGCKAVLPDSDCKRKKRFKSILKKICLLLKMVNTLKKIYPVLKPEGETGEEVPYSANEPRRSQE
ncbi:hypothetical protein EVAR_91301_1 [Eumeta japonica]|uniref:Uncharacterized protein n=1 Tax=Eumeta variegata TaxID=151549 RepID=A0A4C1TL80_EUMVA|nr:hypothetical protein EVAR_91301_1 [Eumeta japonica]